jgi:protoheme IX farnesyltransferase
MTPGEAIAIAGVMSATGFAMLWLAASAAPAVIAVMTLAIYLVVYTPMKRMTSLSTVVGAIPGALPPVIGWTAAGGSLASAAPWSLFLIMFVWQLPHFLAIAWMFRDDYARAGLRMLPVVDRDGVLTGSQTALWAATLVPVTLLPYLLRLASGTYAIAALVLGVAFLVFAARFMARRTDERARALFYASITYLPLLFGFMGAGRV